MRNPLFAAAVAALGLSVMAAGAAQAEGPANLRQLNQERRIDAGTRSGKLTHGEATRLRGEQRSIEQLKASLKARHGGHLTKADVRLIHARQNAANRHILRQKRNARRGKNHLKL